MGSAVIPSRGGVLRSRNATNSTTHSYRSATAALGVWALGRARNALAALTWDNPLVWPRDHGRHPLADLEGPEYQLLAPFRTIDLASEAERAAGDVVWLAGTVRDRATRSPIGDAVLDVWQASPRTGRYSKLDGSLRGRFRADARGRYVIRTVRPPAVELRRAKALDRLLLGLPRRALAWTSGHAVRWERPAHVHVIVRALGYAPLTTQLYVDGSDERVEGDVANVLRPPRAALRVELAPSRIAGRGDVEASRRARATRPVHQIDFDFTLDRRAGGLEPASTGGPRSSA